jgi:hypothetical protein
MRKTGFNIILSFAVPVVVALITVIPTSYCFSQWSVKELYTLSGKISASDMIVVGKIGKDTSNEIAWLVGEQTGGHRIIVLNGSNGEVMWRSKTFHKLFPSSVKIADVDGNNTNELIFSGQLTSFDPITLYVVSSVQETAVESPGNDNIAEQPEKKKENTTPPVTEVKPVSTTEHGPQQTVQPQYTPPTKHDSIPAQASKPQEVQQPVHYLPDNISAAIPYSVPEKSSIRIEIFNGTGDMVRTLVSEESEAGKFSKTWDGTDNKGNKVPVGTYFYTVTIGKITQVRKSIVFQQ